jgi:hypothetical protein
MYTNIECFMNEFVLEFGIFAIKNEMPLFTKFYEDVEYIMYAMNEKYTEKIIELYNHIALKYNLHTVCYVEEMNEYKDYGLIGAKRDLQPVLFVM